MTEDWRVYPSGSQERWLAHENTPPWRRPRKEWNARPDRVTSKAWSFDDDNEGARRDKERAVHYVCSGDEENDRVNLALLLRRPLLVRGIPGIGKSTLAYHIAYRMGLGRPFRWEIRSSTTLQEGLYAYDAVGHFHKGVESPVQDHVRLGPLGTAMLPTERPSCLLVDELDKSSYDLPNDLLHVFEEGSFPVPELERVESAPVRTLDGREAVILNGEVRCHHHPVIIITTNEEREFSPAFLRRCVELTLDAPTAEQFAEIVRQWLGDGDFESALKQLEGHPTDRRLQALFLNATHGAPMEEILKALVRDVQR
jgi:MoxR-like ATPase